MTDPVQYGSDRAGLVYAYGFEPHQRGRAIDTLFILTVVTVLALPMTIIPGLFGMNVGGIPFAQSERGFWAVLVVVLVVVASGVGLAWTRARRW